MSDDAFVRRETESDNVFDLDIFAQVDGLANIRGPEENKVAVD